MTITTVFFDLDDTLYPADSGLWDQIRDRIGKYMSERMGIPADQVPTLRHQLFEQYGTTLRGLQVNYHVDTKDFLAFVHDVPLREYLRQDDSLRAVLETLPTRNFIFTNADTAHARRVLRVLALEDYFEGIVDILAIDPYCKPMPQSFDIALRLAGESDPRKCAMIDDIPRTTRAARQKGLYSILVGRTGDHIDADATLADWADLPGLLSLR